MSGNGFTYKYYIYVYVCVCVQICAVVCPSVLQLYIRVCQFVFTRVWSDYAQIKSLRVCFQLILTLLPNLTLTDSPHACASLGRHVFASCAIVCRAASYMCCHQTVTVSPQSLWKRMLFPHIHCAHKHITLRVPHTILLHPRPTCPQSTTTGPRPNNNGGRNALCILASQACV